LQPIDGHLWKFLRLRPSNFPTLRIAQFAKLVHHSSHLFSKILECKKIRELETLFKVNASEYWNTHYVFNKSSTEKLKYLGKSAIHTILINTVIPFLFTYGKEKQLEDIRERALAFMDAIPSEKNHIIDKWEEMNINSRSAFQSQALIQLKNEYCYHKKCLNCSIGNRILTDN